jgi:DNA-binding MarR family transcriptional regulator
MYDNALKPSGVKITQFGILKILATSPGLTTGEMAAAFGVDSTTLTRTLKVIRDCNWIESTEGEDRRERHWTITDAGRVKLKEAQPLWKAAQKALEKSAKEIDLDSLTNMLFHLTQQAGK